jgi:hypothetical protein
LRIALWQNNISVNIRGHYMKWLRFYLDFCSKYRHDSNNSESIIALQKKLLEKRKSERLHQQPSHAIRLYLNVNQANTVSRSPSFLPIATVNNAENANTRESLTFSTTNKFPLDTAPTVLATPKSTLKPKPETTEEPTPRTVAISAREINKLSRILVYKRSLFSKNQKNWTSQGNRQFTADPGLSF